MNEKEQKLFNELIDKYVKERYDLLIRAFEQTILFQKSKIEDLKIIVHSQEKANLYRNKIIKDLTEELQEIKDQFYRNELTHEELREIVLMDYKEC